MTLIVMHEVFLEVVDYENFVWTGCPFGEANSTGSTEHGLTLVLIVA